MKLSRDNALTLLKLFGFLFALDVFFVAIKLLGAFKDIGSGMGETMMVELAARPLMGVLLGVLVTSVIQSSSTTTSIIVGLAAAGTFGDTPAEALQAAVPIIMGANIGTTVTNTIVSFGHVGDNREFRRAFAAATVHDVFNLMAVVILLPIQAATNFLGRIAVFVAQALENVGGLRLFNPLKFVIGPQTDLVKHAFDSQALVDFVIILALVLGMLFALGYLEKRARQQKKHRLHAFGVAVAIALVSLAVKTYHPFIFSKPTAVFITGLGLLLVSLYAIVAIMRSMVLVRVQRLFREYVFNTGLRALVVGMILTALVQSSSVTTSLAVPLAGAGLVTLRQIFPFTLGANIGTTITAFLAALSLGQPIALAVALAHLFFNLIGIGLLYPVEKIRNIPLKIAETLAEAATRWKLVPIVYVLGVYIILPLALIWLSGEAG